LNSGFVRFGEKLRPPTREFGFELFDFRFPAGRLRLLPAPGPGHAHIRAFSEALMHAISRGLRVFTYLLPCILEIVQCSFDGGGCDRVIHKPADRQRETLLIGPALDRFVSREVMASPSS
jgi:hypothetical protein